MLISCLTACMPATDENLPGPLRSVGCDLDPGADCIDISGLLPEADLQPVPGFPAFIS